MKKILILAALALSIMVNAQYTRAGGGAFSFGVQTLETAGLRQFYTEAPTLNTANFTFGGYGYAQFDAFLFGFSGAGIYGFEADDASNTYYFGGGYFAFDFGYKVINKQKWSLYPMANVGLGGVGYTISQNADMTVGGGEVPIFNNANYGWGSMVYGVGVRFERYFKLKDDCEGGKSAGLFGVEAGYLNSPKNADWTTGSRNRIIGGPDFSFESIYLRLTLGGFGGI
jgi:hypothetical protein